MEMSPTGVRSDPHFPHPLSSLVGETLDQSIYLIVVVAAGKFQKLSDKRVAPFGSLWNKQGAAFNEVRLVDNARFLVFGGLEWNDI